MTLEPPVIDISGLEDGDPRSLARIADELRPACSEWGAFQVVGHSLPESELAATELAIRRLFELPRESLLAARRTRENARGFYDEELTKNRPDWKEVFDFGAEQDSATPETAHSDGVNQWPSGSAELAPILRRHFLACERLGLALLRALCVSLELPPDRLDASFGAHSSFVRLNRYPPCPTPASADAPLLPEVGHLGVHHHSDAGALTLVLQDDVAGLQLLRDDRFHVVPPISGAFAVNLGDMLQVWSNDRYRSPVHRVLTHRDRARHSAPFFLNPAYEAVCEPLPELLGPDGGARFRPISWAHFRDRRSAGDYADYGAEIQIDDYRLA